MSKRLKGILWALHNIWRFSDDMNVIRKRAAEGARDAA